MKNIRGEYEAYSEPRIRKGAIMPNQNQPLVYFFAKSNFGDTNPDFIKIGYTRTELPLRKAALQTGSESVIWAIGVLPFEVEAEARREEKRIHEHFGGFRAHGEWFYATPRILQYIEDYAVQYTERFTEDVPSTPDEEVTEPDAQPTKNEEAIAFGKWIKECRDQKNNMTSDDVAKSVGCTAGYIRHIEAGWGMPGRNLRDALIALFGDVSDSITKPISRTLAVKMENGDLISKDTGIDTFIKVIKAIGIERVKALNLHVNGIPLIADCEYDSKAQREFKIETETYYIVSGTDTMRKKKILDHIAGQLKLNMSVFVNAGM